MAELPFLGQTIPGDITQVKDAVCPGCGTDNSTWIVSQPHGKLWVCGESLHVETEGHVEGIQKIIAHITRGVF